MNIPESGSEKSSNRRRASETSDTSEKGNEELCWSEATTGGLNPDSGPHAERH